MKFNELGVNLPFFIKGDPLMKSKIDDSRYITVGDGSGATCLSPEERENLEVTPV